MHGEDNTDYRRVYIRDITVTVRDGWPLKRFHARFNAALQAFLAVYRVHWVSLGVEKSRPG
jgi:hypothetical protein